jgi:hypothetical protein
MKISREVIILYFLCIFINLGLSGCQGGTQADAAKAVEDYYQALVDKDSARLGILSCADWEDDAMLELDSLATVTASLKDLQCQVVSEEGDTTLVSCSGALLANYNGEDQEISLADQSYAVVQEGGEWRMCGYR